MSIFKESTEVGDEKMTILKTSTTIFAENDRFE
jgi:hypothetical protein